MNGERWLTSLVKLDVLEYRHRNGIHSIVHWEL